MIQIPLKVALETSVFENARKSAFWGHTGHTERAAGKDGVLSTARVQGGVGGWRGILID